MTILTKNNYRSFSFGLAFMAMQLVGSFASAQMMKQDYIRAAGKDGSKAILSTYGTTIDEESMSQGLAPRGSSALTGAGALEAEGIKYIIHAAPGSMNQGSENTKPTLEGIKLSIVNALRIANAEKIKRVAIPLIGGGIFLNSLGISRDELASLIIKTALATSQHTEVVFVAYDADDAKLMESAAAQLATPKVIVTAAKKAWTTNVISWIRSLFVGKKATPAVVVAKKATVVTGSIAYFAVHGADAIVNAANTELTFGGGLSGVIGRATQNQEKINQSGTLLISEFYDLNM